MDRDFRASMESHVDRNVVSRGGTHAPEPHSLLLGTPPRSSHRSLLGKTWGNVRIVLGTNARSRMVEYMGDDTHGHEEEDGHDDNDENGATVARLYFTTTTHPVIRHVLEGFEFSDTVSLHALAVQNVMNNRGPDALVGSIPGEQVHSVRLLDMCRLCHETASVLISRTKDVDVVLVPRRPDVAERDSLFFLVYATNIKAVDLCESLRKERKVAVVLDVDNTLVDAEPFELDDEQKYAWIEREVQTSNGTMVRGRIAHLTHVEDDLDQDGAFLIHWSSSSYAASRASLYSIDYCFHVRIRKGWCFLRSFLIEHESKFMTFVCSMGKREYVELIWHGLDPDSGIIPTQAWCSRITSTYPDTLDEAAKKTALIALSCSTVHDRYAETHLAAPYICIDDCPESYEEPYRSSVLLVEPFSRRNTEAAGNVWSMITEKMDAYWNATCGELGTFAWQAAQSFSTAILHAMQTTVMESPNALQYLQKRCSKQGELLWRQITVEYVLPGLSATSHGQSHQQPDGSMPSRRSLDDSFTRESTSYASLGLGPISRRGTSPMSISPSNNSRGTKNHANALPQNLRQGDTLNGHMMMQW